MVTDLNVQSLHLSDVAPRLLHHGVPVDIGEKAEAEPVALSHDNVENIEKYENEKRALPGWGP